MRWKILLSCIALTACAGSADTRDAERVETERLADEQPADVGAPTYYRDVKPILDQKCTQCHAQGGMAPFALQSFGDVGTRARAISSAVGSGRMPPWTAVGPLDQYIGDRRLTDAQKSVITAWAEQGGAEGDPSEEPAHPPPDRRGLPRIDATLPISGEFTPSKDPDQYRCFAIDWPYKDKKYITGLGITPGRVDMVHHAIVYLISPSGAQRVRNSDAADPEPGYDCYGASGAWLTSYEPGGFGEENPDKIGFEVQPGSVLLLQVHYNTMHSGKHADRSRVDVMVDDSVERVGRVNLIMNPLWPAGFMSIPANRPDVKMRYQGRPSGLSSSQTYQLYWADLHMHTLGKSGSIGIVRKGSSTPEPLLTIPKWAFEWQETYLFKEPVLFHPGDQLYVECHFDNTEAHQLVVNGERMPVRNVNWGEKTTDEMCLGNVLSTPYVAPVEPPPSEPPPAEQPPAEPTP